MFIKRSVKEYVKNVFYNVTIKLITFLCFNFFRNTRTIPTIWVKCDFAR